MHPTPGCSFQKKTVDQAALGYGRQGFPTPTSRSTPFGLGELERGEVVSPVGSIASEVVGN
jgi:hypothetical protein